MIKIKCKEHNGENICSLPLKDRDVKLKKEVNCIRRKYPVFITNNFYEMFSVDKWANHLED